MEIAQESAPPRIAASVLPQFPGVEFIFTRWMQD
jgi:hypothetical protein